MGEELSGTIPVAGEVGNGGKKALAGRAGPWNCNLDYRARRAVEWALVLS
jgi:hypothetical protein